jgi:thiamine biosynthesis lipoprotein
MYLTERHQRAMGSDAQVLVYAATQRAADELAHLALIRVQLLEQCWSRFLPDSELNLLNARAGKGPVSASPDLEALVATMLEAAAWTDGAYDPTVLGAVRANGYDADFAEVIARDSLRAIDDLLAPSLGTAGIVIDQGQHTVSLPSGVGIDPGAIGKGLAADIVADEIHAAGAEGILVNLGGDVSVRGTAGGHDWTVGIQDDRVAGSPVMWQMELNGDCRAVATSSSLRRRWNGRHHVIDPITGQPSQSDLAQVTVAAPQGWQAEAATTYALVRGSQAAIDWLQDHSLEALLFPHDPASPPLRVSQPLRVRETHHA